MEIALALIGGVAAGFSAGWLLRHRRAVRHAARIQALVEHVASDASKAEQDPKQHPSAREGGAEVAAMLRRLTSKFKARLADLDRERSKTSAIIESIEDGLVVLDRAKSIVEVRVTILDPDVRVKPEMTASVTFQEHKSGQDGQERGQTPGLTPSPIVLVPKRAITEQNNQPFVWVVAGGTASRRPVTRGADRLDQVEVRSGVSAGDAVIVNPPAGLQDSTLVRIKGS